MKENRGLKKANQELGDCQGVRAGGLEVVEDCGGNGVERQKETNAEDFGRQAMDTNGLKESQDMINELKGEIRLLEAEKSGILGKLEQMRSEIAESQLAVAQVRAEKILGDEKQSGLQGLLENQAAMLRQVRAELEEKKGLLVEFATKSRQSEPGKPSPVAIQVLDKLEPQEPKPIHDKTLSLDKIEFTSGASSKKSVKKPRTAKGGKILPKIDESSLADDPNQVGPQDTFDSMAQNGQGLFQSSPSSYVNSVPDNLGTELARKAIEIDGLSRSVYKQKKMINGLNVSVMTKNQEISDYKAIVDSQASEIADLEAQLEVLKVTFTKSKSLG